MCERNRNENGVADAETATGKKVGAEGVAEEAVGKNAGSPRLAIARYFPSVGVRVHGSWDHIYQTPSFENILLASSPQTQALDTSLPVVQLPVEPAHGNYYELGATNALFGKLRLDTNMYRRDVKNYADDSQIFRTGISFPIDFNNASFTALKDRLGKRLQLGITLRCEPDLATRCRPVRTGGR